MADELNIKRIIELQQKTSPEEGDSFAVDNATSGTSRIMIQNLLDPTFSSNLKAAPAEETKKKIDEVMDVFAAGIDEAVDNWLDEHPEATTTVQDGSLTYKKLVTGTLGFVTPEMFGAKGDGVTDDTIAIQTALDAGGIIICENEYLIGEIEINKPIIIIGEGKFTSNDDENIYLLNVLSNDVFIYGITIDCLYKCNGIKIDNSKNIKIENVEVKNCDGGSSNSNGIYINRCSDVTIYICVIHNIKNENSIAVRGIQSNRSNKVTINKCIVYEIHSGNDADGIHFIFDGSADESEYKSVINECDIYECDKRYIKIQQKHVLISNCSFMADKSTTLASNCSIAVYDDFCTIENCFINGKSQNQIYIGGASEDTNILKNFTLNNCVIIDYGEAYQGLVQTSGTRSFEGITITNNHFKCNSKTNRGIYIKNVDAKNIKVINNTFENCGQGVLFRYDNHVMTIKNVVICDNIIEADYPISISGNGEQIKIYGFIVCNNEYNAIVAFDGYANFIYCNRALENFDTNLITVYGNKPTADSEAGVYGFRELVATYGATARRPSVGLPYGTFFDTTTHKTWTYYDGNWYLADGTAAQ